MVDIQIPATNIGYTHVLPTQFGRLHVPNDIFTIGVLVPNFHKCCCNTVYSLLVHIEAVPRICELNHWISFESFLEEDTFYRYSKMDKG